MRYAVIYSSKTGNTRLIAETVQRTLPDDDCVAMGAPGPDALQAELLFIGFWTDQGGCDPEIHAFLRECHDKKVALFGTAGFGAEQSYFDGVLERVKSGLPADAEYLGGFMCQGKMPAGVKVRYEAALAKEPENPRWKTMLQNFEAAATHPDENDRAAAAAFAKGLWDGQTRA